MNHHLVRVFGNALLLSVIGAGLQLSQIPDLGRGCTGPTGGNVLGAAVGQELGQTSAEVIRRGINVAPTIEIRPGHAFNVMVTQDLVSRGRTLTRCAPVQSYPAAELKGRAPGELHRALTGYAAYYRETTGQSIEVWASGADAPAVRGHRLQVPGVAADPERA